MEQYQEEVDYEDERLLTPSDEEEHQALVDRQAADAAREAAPPAAEASVSAVVVLCSTSFRILQYSDDVFVQQVPNAPTGPQASNVIAPAAQAQVFAVAILFEWVSTAQSVTILLSFSR